MILEVQTSERKQIFNGRKARIETPSPFNFGKTKLIQRMANTYRHHISAVALWFVFQFWNENRWHSTVRMFMFMFGSYELLCWWPLENCAATSMQTATSIFVALGYSQVIFVRHTLTISTFQLFCHHNVHEKVPRSYATKPHNSRHILSCNEWTTIIASLRILLSILFIWYSF